VILATATKKVTKICGAKFFGKLVWAQDPEPSKRPGRETIDQAELWLTP